MEMSQGMPSPGAPAPKAPPASDDQEGGGGARELISGIHSGLIKFMELLDQEPSIAPEEKQELGSLIQGFQSLVEKLGQPQGQPAPKAPSPTGAAPMEAGMSGAKPAL